MSSFLPTPLLGSSGTSYAIRINQHLLTSGTIEIQSPSENSSVFSVDGLLHRAIVENSVGVCWASSVPL